MVHLGVKKMNDLYIFLNTEIKDSGIFSRIGNLGLAPVRYLFNGKTIGNISREIGKEIDMEYMPPLKANSCIVRMIETALAIILLVPGLLLASSKGLAYLFSEDIRRDHAAVKKFFTPVDIDVGSASHPIKSYEEFRDKLSLARDAHPVRNAFIIHGDGNFTIDKDPGFLFLPMKIILNGVNIASTCQPFNSRWAVDVEKCKKWDNLKIHHVNSVDEALKATAPRRSWFSCKRYHQIFSVAKPQTV